MNQPKQQLPRTLEQILAAAATNSILKAALLADRLSTVDAMGFTLSAGERDILLAVSDEQLRAMLDRLASSAGPLDVSASPPRTIREGTATGCLADFPELADRSSTDSHPEPAMGKRPGKLLLAAVAVTVVTAGAAGLYLILGGRPDAPVPVIEAAEPGQRAGDRADAGSARDTGPPVVPGHPGPRGAP